MSNLTDINLMTSLARTIQSAAKQLYSHALAGFDKEVEAGEKGSKMMLYAKVGDTALEVEALADDAATNIDLLAELQPLPPLAQQIQDQYEGEVESRERIIKDG